MALEGVNTTTEGARPGYRWNRRWFVLENSVLYYYSEQGSPTAFERLLAPVYLAAAPQVLQSASFVST